MLHQKLKSLTSAYSKPTAGAEKVPNFHFEALRTISAKKTQSIEHFYLFKKEYLINFRADQPYTVGMDSMTQISSDRRNEIIQRSSGTI